MERRLQNLSDETAFVQQLDAAYSDFVDTLKKRIFLEVKQEELTKLITRQIALEEELGDQQIRQQGFSAAQSLNADNISFNLDANATVKELQAFAKLTDEEIEKQRKGS